jgi:hypothetical protein
MIRQLSDAFAGRNASVLGRWAQPPAQFLGDTGINYHDAWPDWARTDAVRSVLNLAEMLVLEIGFLGFCAPKYFGPEPMLSHVLECDELPKMFFSDRFLKSLGRWAFWNAQFENMRELEADFELLTLAELPATPVMSSAKPEPLLRPQTYELDSNIPELDIGPSMSGSASMTVSSGPDPEDSVPSPLVANDEHQSLSGYSSRSVSITSSHDSQGLAARNAEIAERRRRREFWVYSCANVSTAPPLVEPASSEDSDAHDESSNNGENDEALLLDTCRSEVDEPEYSCQSDPDD